MKHAYLLLLMSTLFLFSCKDENNDKNATGVFEATEVIISAEATGRLLKFNAREGQDLEPQHVVGQIDTIQLSLKKMQLRASQLALQSSKPDVASQIKATEREIEKLELEKTRTQKLIEGDVATQKQLDDILAQLDVLKARLKAQKKNLNSSIGALDAQYKALEVQIDQLNDQIERCAIRSSIAGTVLVKYAEQGEFVNMGKPLFKVANMKDMILRAYITVAQLKELRLNQSVMVLAEYGESELKEYEGNIVWISDKSEFTPKTIQTQDERANLVYAVKVAVKNDSYLKIGMYGGLKWTIE